MIFNKYTGLPMTIGEVIDGRIIGRCMEYKRANFTERVPNSEVVYIVLEQTKNLIEFLMKKGIITEQDVVDNFSDTTESFFIGERNDL